MDAGDWRFTEEEVERPPTVVQHGWALGREREQRQRCCLFIADVGATLRLPQLSISTAHVFFHRFYMVASMADHEPYLVATACLFLAAKVEDSPKKLREVTERAAEQLAVLGDAARDVDSQVVAAEYCLLQTLAFDLFMEHPYAAVLHLVPTLPTAAVAPTDAPADCAARREELAQAAWNFLNDSFSSVACLRFDGPTVAAACVFLALLYCHASEDGAVAAVDAAAQDGALGGRPLPLVRAAARVVASVYADRPEMDALRARFAAAAASSASHG
jgi:hypothetical protein